ncbi:MAG: hypothetical protein HY298_13705 [Verrucomicrobia bacterium]|nr:hypothetical protein [Verrucomicrobiota bacterium]
MPVTIGQNFTGTTEDSNNPIFPPDCSGAIGPQYFVEFINGSFTVYNRTNGLSVKRITDVKFWSDAGINASGYPAVSDPRVIYDPISQRWFATQVNANANATDPTIYANDFLLAVSASTDPKGVWYGFLFQADPDNGYFADFPTLGVDSNAVYVAGDFFHGDTNAVGPGLVSIPKADLLAATPTIANRTWFGVMDYATRGQVLQPAICFDGSGGGRVLAMGDIGSDSDLHSNLVTFAVQNAATTNATLTASTSITVSPYVVPFNYDLGYPLFNPTQPDGTTTLQANDARLSAKVYGVNGVLFAVHNTELNDRIAIRWYRINATTGALLESGTLADPDLDLFFPSIAANSSGTVVIAYNGSSAGTYVSCYASAGQTINGVTTFGNRILLQSGLDNYHDLLDIFAQLFGEVVDSRWGDYSTLSVDPNDPNRFWSIQMYPQSSDPDTGAGIWSTQITELITTPLVSLAIAPSGTNMTVSWSTGFADYQLQSATNLSPPIAWSDVAQARQTNGSQLVVLLPASAGNQFFRLKK